VFSGFNILPAAAAGELGRSAAENAMFLKRVLQAAFVLLLSISCGCSRTQRDDDHGRPVEQIAHDLGVTPEQFREAFKKVKPAPHGERPTEAQREANRKVLSESLGVSPEKLDEVMDKYRPEGKISGPSEQ
jgi:hypothetical protein